MKKVISICFAFALAVGIAAQAGPAEASGKPCRTDCVTATVTVTSGPGALNITWE